MQFDALEKSVMGQQIRAFKNCNEWKPPAYNTTEDEKVHILN